MAFATAMRRVVVIGCSGSGKTTLARAMGEQLGLPVIHMDTLFYQPGWKPCDWGLFRAKLAEAIAGDAWITDGHFVETLDLSLPSAELVVFVQQARWLRLWRVTWRWLTTRGMRPDLPAGCPEQFDWPLLKFIWTFDREVRPRTEAALAAYATPVVRLDGDRQIAAFLASLDEPERPR
jgi:adenylate kinase family enzyme